MSVFAERLTKTISVIILYTMLDCKKGYIKRDRYVKKNGTVVPEKCIRATSMYGTKAEDVTTPIIRKMLAKQALAEKVTAKDSPKKCPPGMIRRSAYIRQPYESVRTDDSGHKKTVSVKRTIVPADCIKERGTPNGKSGLYDPKTGKRIYIYVEPDVLSKYGYYDIKNKTAVVRHAALDKAYIGLDKNWLSLFRMLNYLAVVNKSHKSLHGLIIADRNYVKRKYNLEHKMEK